MFMINQQILQFAIEQTEKKHRVDLSEDLVYSLVSQIYDKKERMLFWEAVRYSLNELRLYDQGGNKKRAVYKSAACTYFLKISALARSARAAVGKPKKAVYKPASVTGSVVIEMGGQYALKL